MVSGTFQDIARQGRITPQHRFIRWLLLLHIPPFVVVGLDAGWSVPHTVTEVVVPLVAFWLVARITDRPRLAMTSGGIGLMYISAVLIHLTGGVTEAHFYFFVAFGLVALYRDWAVFFAAAAFAVGHHALFALAGGSLFRQEYQVEDPLLWASVHVGFVAIVTGVQAVGMWQVASSVSARSQLESELALAEARRRTALDLHDNVVQALATAKHAASLGEQALSVGAVDQALSASQELVSELLSGIPLDERTLVRSTAASGHA